jgi:uncharacterized protein (TIGR04551 family)
VSPASRIAVATFGLALSLAGEVRAAGFSDIGQDITPREKFEAKLDGYLRTRGEGLYNLDLDRGLLPNGQPIFPTALGDPRAQWLTHADMRLRTDLSVYAPGGGVAVKVRLDTLDNMALGSMPEGVPYASLTQRATGNIFSLRRAYGQALLPFGVLAVGRMGNHWGLGMFANGGDCIDCDSGDSVDRVAFATPLAGHVFAFAFDYSATLALAPRADDRTIAIAPMSNVRSLSLAMLRFKDDLGRERRRKAGKTTVEYGLLGSYRWQDGDVPAAYLPQPTGGAVELTGAQLMGRGAKYFVADGWTRITHPEFSFGAEFVYAGGQVDNASLIPGVITRQPVKSSQIGFAVETEIGTVTSPFGLGVDGGYASGDPGATLGAVPFPPPGNRVDSFRFHPDYHIDRILFREIIGQVTGAFYVRPHARARIFKMPTGELRAEVATIASFSSAADWSPSGERPLGIEVDPGLVYKSRDGFYVALDYGILFPLSGMDNPKDNLKAQMAETIRLRFAFLFGGGQ